MNILQLQSQIKSRNRAYFHWFLLGSHYGYLGSWRLQILYWITLGGFGVWALVDLFTLSAKIEQYNARILAQIEFLEQQEKAAYQARYIALIKARRN